MSRSRHIDLLLTLTTLLVFLPVGFAGFINYDDPDYVTNNSFVKHGLTWTDISWAFTTFHAGNWHPLTWLSHMLDCQIFGLNPGAQHFVNVLWHVLNVALLFAWLMRLTGKPGPAAFIAALFAWHPLHVESVAWISERKDVLSTFFALLSLLAYTIYAQENKRRCLWLALIFFALGLLAKPMLVTLPFLLLLLDFWPLKRLVPFRRPVFTEKIPFFVLALASGVVTLFAQHHVAAVASLHSVPLLYRLENAPVAVAGYLQKFFLPVDLCFFYPLRSAIPGSEAALSVMILVLISALAWRWRAGRPYFLMGWLWFLITLAPVIGLVQVGVQAMADRYTYLPSIGFFIMLVFLLAELVERLRLPKILATGLAVLVCAGCLAATEYQLSFWHNSETLYRRALAVTQDNEVAHLDLGAELIAQGRSDEALVEFREALRIEPGWFQTYNNIGYILEERGRPKEAVAEYQKAIRINPRISFVHKNLGISLTELGKYDEAEHEFSEAKRLDPLDSRPHWETARLFLAQGRDLDALPELQTAIQLEPDHPDLLASAAQVLAADQIAGARDGRTALTWALKANALAGGNATTLDVLGMAQAENGDYTNAATSATQALRRAQTAGMNSTNAIRARLELYQQGQPWRESFRATNTPIKSP